MVRVRTSSRTMAVHDLYNVCSIGIHTRFYHATVLLGSLWWRWRRRWQRAALVPLTHKHTYLCYTMLLYTSFSRCRYALMPVHTASRNALVYVVLGRFTCGPDCNPDAASWIFHPGMHHHREPKVTVCRATRAVILQCKFLTIRVFMFFMYD